MCLFVFVGFCSFPHSYGEIKFSFLHYAMSGAAASVAVPLVLLNRNHANRVDMPSDGYAVR